MDFLKEAQEKMDKAVEATKHRFQSIRAGRASIAMLRWNQELNNMVQWSALNQVANVSAPEARVLNN